MSTVSISIKIQPKVKSEAEEIASGLGVSLPDLINSYLKQVIKNKSLILKKTEKPTSYLLQSIKTAERERKAGKASLVFNNPEDAIQWLNN